MFRNVCPHCVGAAALFGVAILVGCTGAGSSGESGSKARAAETAAGDVEIRDIPDGDAETLLKFIKDLAQEEPEGSGAELDAEIVKALNTMLVASQRLLDANPDEDQFAQAHFYRLKALNGLRFMKQPHGAANYEAAVTAAMNDPNQEIVRLGWQEFLDEKIALWDTLSVKRKAAFTEQVLTKVKTDKPTEFDVRIVGNLVGELERVDEGYVKMLLDETLPGFKKSDDPDVQETLKAARLEGVARRLELPGNEIKVFGTLLTGGEIDWKSYRGKVVLLDFGASWCPECVREAPNVADMYASYKDKGFDVVAVSLDRTPEAAEMYAAQTKADWATLFPEKKEDRFWNHPLARYYGIGSAPTVILIDREGKVVHMNARGKILRELLRQMLGEPSAEPARPAVGPQRQAS
jgi:thiol-disulfide isomerase/thioredoxin